MNDPLDPLPRILRPAGGGVYVVSTGLAEQRALQRRIYRAETDDAIDAAWRRALRCVDGNSPGRPRVVVLGVPSDTGAGFTRGANRAPATLRAHLLDRREHAIWADDVIDAGDVFVVPQLLTDEMLAPAQIAATREALYGDPAVELPVAPLDLCARALRELWARHPSVVPVVVGGDHSVGWPAFHAAFTHHEQRRGRRLGLLHFDAHTDLLEHRLGIKYCFATWAWHANELLGRDGRLVQVGVRASAKSRDHWEKTLGVRQIRADDALARGPEALADEVIERFERLGVEALYVSNDIDGTSDEYAAATGTPEPGGLTPEIVRGLTRRVAERFPLVGGDLVEVAPPLAGGREGEPGRTLDTAADYLDDLIRYARPR